MGRSVVSTEATETGTRRETGSCRPKWSPIPTTADTWIPVSEPRGKLSSGHLSGVGFGWYLARISLQKQIEIYLLNLSIMISAIFCICFTCSIVTRANVLFHSDNCNRSAARQCNRQSRIVVISANLGQISSCYRLVEIRDKYSRTVSSVGCNLFVVDCWQTP